MLSLFRRRSTSQKNFDQQLVFQLSKSRIPSPRQFKFLGHFIKGQERLLLYFFITLIIAGLSVIGIKAYAQHIELVPKAGGRYIEGVVGNPQYVNPLYTPFNSVDGDLERLIFSRLFTLNSQGIITPDLVSNYTISPDQKTYTMTLREASWSDESPVTVDDVLFTFNLIQNPDYRSPLRGRFIGITADKQDDKTIVFTLTEPYGQFTSLLTFGILPGTLWEGINSTMMPLAELNLKPIGSGPYKLKSLTKTSNGTIRSYTLERNPHYYGQSPYLDEIVFKFFPSPEEMIGALNKGQLNGIANLPVGYKDTIIAKNSLQYQTIIQPYVTGIFFNLSSKFAISEKSIRQALTALNREDIIQQTASQTEIPTQHVLMPHQPGFNELPTRDQTEARNLLDEAGWKLRTLTDTDIQTARETKDAKIAGNIVALGTGTWSMKDNQGLVFTLTAPESLQAVAKKIADTWQELGIKINLKIEKDEVIQAQVVANKNFDILLYTENIDTGDPYPFWTTNAPGNITNYSNKDVDSWLTEARVTGDAAAVAERYQKFQTKLNEDVPVIPLYWNTYVYPQTKKLKGQSQAVIQTPADRLASIYNWYFKVKRQLK